MMPQTRLSEADRFVIIDGLHIDRAVFGTLATWAENRGLPIQDAIQLALCFFNEHREKWTDGTLTPAPTKDAAA